MVFGWGCVPSALFSFPPLLHLTKRISVNGINSSTNTDPFSLHFISEPVRHGALDQSILIRARFNISCQTVKQTCSIFSTSLFPFRPSSFHRLFIPQTFKCVFLQITTTAVCRLFTKCNYVLSLHCSTQLHQSVIMCEIYNKCLFSCPIIEYQYYIIWCWPKRVFNPPDYIPCLSDINVLSRPWCHVPSRRTRSNLVQSINN